MSTTSSQLDQHRSERDHDKDRLVLRRRLDHKALTVLERYADRLPFDRLISGQYPLGRINSVIERMQAFREIKPVLLPGAAS